MKNIVICCDGTWNERSSRTHIVRIADAATALLGEDCVHYDEGPGARDSDVQPESWLNWLADKVGGGAFGKGVSHNIREAYEFVARTYRDGDQLYLFGFSRGAYTVRSLAGLIAYAGLLQPGDLDEAEDAFEAYRTRDPGARATHRWLRSRVAERARRAVPIRFLGVFDTVGALGIPVGWLQSLDEWFNPDRAVSFHDTRLGADVIDARHAMAIDERRGPFAPTLWTGVPVPGQRIRQVWFAGVHSDVGGGYDDKRLAEVPLGWMLDELAEAGLELRDRFRTHDPLHPSVLGEMHDSVSPVYSWAHLLPSIDYYRRPIGRTERMRRSQNAPEVPGEAVSWSALERIAADAAPVEGEWVPYRPRSLPVGENGVPLALGDIEIDDRRAEIRVDVTLSAEIAGVGGCVIRDLSRMGARLSLADVASRDGPVILHADDARIGRRLAVIRWRNPTAGEIGVQFDEPIDLAAA